MSLHADLVVNEVRRLIASDTGTEVNNRTSEHLGSIRNLMYDKVPAK